MSNNLTTVREGEGVQLQDGADVNNYQSDQFIILLQQQQQHM